MNAIFLSAKCKMGDTRGIEKEVNRSPDHPMNFVGSDIDWSKTPYNRSLVESENFRKSIKSVLAEHGITKYRRDAVVMIDSVFTFSPEFAEKASPETIDSYFKDCLAFAEKYLGVVINAQIHVDEKTIHLHVETVPIVKNDDGTFSLSAKRLMGNKADYCRRQDLFYEEVGEKYGFDKCIKQDDRIEKRVHIDTLEYKAQMRAMELERLTTDVEAKTDLLEKKEVELQTKSSELNDVNNELRLKTSVLETAFHRVEQACETLYGYVEHIYKALAEKVNSFINKVFEKAILTSDDFYEAHLSTEEVYTSDSSCNGLYIPITGEGERLTWSGQSPIYENFEEDTFVPYGSIDTYGRIETENLFDWSERFAEEGLIDFIDPAEKEVMYALDDLSSVKNDIAKALGYKTDVEIANEQLNYHEPIDQSDTESDDDQIDNSDQIDPPDTNNEDDDSGYDDIGYD